MLSSTAKFTRDINPNFIKWLKLKEKTINLFSKNRQTIIGKNEMDKTKRNG